VENFSVFDFLGWRLTSVGNFVEANPNHEHFPSQCLVSVGKEAIIFELPSLPSYATVTRHDVIDYPVASLVSIVGFASGEKFTDREVESLAYSEIPTDPFTNLRIAATKAGEAICIVSDFMPNGLTRGEIDAILVRFINESIKRAEIVRQLMEFVSMEDKRGSFSRGVSNKLSDLERECLVSLRVLAKRPWIQQTQEQA
jgi:hypothetical protein